MNRTPWTPEEDTLLREQWMAGADARPLLRSRSKSAIYRRVRALGLEQRKARWTPAEDARLCMLWNSGDRIKDIAKAMNRPETGVYERAIRLDLKLGCPPGFEYLSASAVRTGVANTTVLRRILRAAGVIIHVATTKDRGKRRWKRRHFVDPSDVDVAMARWNETETAASAARRLGISHWRLCKKLKAAGIGAGRTGKQPFRVTEDDLRQVGATP